MAVTDEAIGKIKEMIVSGVLRPGDRLPKEADLAAELGLSRSSLREAVRALSVLNVLHVRQGDGTYVSSLDPLLLFEAVGFVVDFHRDGSAPEAFQVRSILEPAAAELAATRITEEQLAGLRSLLDGLGEAPGIDELVAADLEFHRRIAAACGIPLLCSLLEAITGPAVQARIWRGLAGDGTVVQALAEHRSLLEALELRDPVTARAWATVHAHAASRMLERQPEQ